MPNWFYFSVNVSGSKEDVRDFVANVQGSKKFDTEGSEFDFNHFIPQPENIFRDSLSTDKENELASKGIPDWYNWNNSNWGTKWNAVVDEVIDFDFYHSENPEIIYDMRTAWAFPSPVIEKMLEKYSNLDFIITGEEESNAYGIYIDSANRIWSEEEPDLVDEENNREVYWSSDSSSWLYLDDDTEVPDSEDFYPVTRYSWS